LIADNIILMLISIVTYTTYIYTVCAMLEHPKCETIS